MFYSCFNAHKGMYDYFEDATTIPVNADLPVPTLPSSAGKIGVPAFQAARPLPEGARPAGTGYNARGILVDCAQSGPALALSGDPAGSAWPPAWKWALAIGVAALTIWVAETKTVKSWVQGGGR